MKTGTMYMLTGMIVVLALLAMAAPAAAWPTGYNYDGYSLSTNESGTVDGYVYIDEGNHSGLAASPYVVGYSGIPDGTVQWAHLYTGVWGGTENYVGWANITVTNSSGTYDLGAARLDINNMASSTSCSGNGKWLICKDVTDYLDGSTLAVTVTTSGTIDGRVYGAVLAAAIESASGNKTAYWVNVGNVNLRYDAGSGELNNALTWMNGTSYASSEAKVYAMQYVGSTNQNDFVYFNAPSAVDSPRNLTNIAWNISKYTKYQLGDNDVADCSEGSYFDLDVFTAANDATALNNVVNLVGNNHLIFWRGHDSNGDGSIEGVWQGSTYEGEVYVSPIVAALVQKDITRLYDFASATPGAAGTDLYAYEGAVSARPPASNTSPITGISTSSALTADDWTYETFVTDADGTYAAQRFVFGIEESAGDIDGLTVTWNGKGYHAGGSGYDGAYLYIWNGSSYVPLDSTTSGNEDTLTGSVTSNIGNYIVSGDVTVLVVQKSPADEDEETASTVETDYIKLVIDPKV